MLIIAVQMAVPGARRKRVTERIQRKMRRELRKLLTQSQDAKSKPLVIRLRLEKRGTLLYTYFLL
jgi:hypothetical protein